MFHKMRWVTQYVKILPSVRGRDISGDQQKKDKCSLYEHGWKLSKDLSNWSIASKVIQIRGQLLREKNDAVCESLYLFIDFQIVNLAWEWRKDGGWSELICKGRRRGSSWASENDSFIPRSQCRENTNMLISPRSPCVHQSSHFKLIYQRKHVPSSCFFLQQQSWSNKTAARVSFPPVNMSSGPLCCEGFSKLLCNNVLQSIMVFHFPAQNYWPPHTACSQTLYKIMSRCVSNFGPVRNRQIFNEFRGIFWPRRTPNCHIYFHFCFWWCGITPSETRLHIYNEISEE